jgi:hypothetical protein
MKQPMSRKRPVSKVTGVPLPEEAEKFILATKSRKALDAACLLSSVYRVLLPDAERLESSSSLECLGIYLHAPTPKIT